MPNDAPPQSVFKREGFAYLYQPAGKNITFRVHDIKSRDGNLFGFVEATAEHPQLPRLLTGTSINITGGRGKPDLAKYLFERSKTPLGDGPISMADWLGMVESLAQRVLQAEQEGDPLEWVGADEPPDTSPYIVNKIIEAGGINYLFGPADQGKSWIARALLIYVQLGLPFCGLATRQMETLLVDYETNRDTDARRVRAILKGLGQPFQNFRRWTPRDVLLRQVKPLGRILASENIGLYGVDSGGHAAGSPGEHGSWEDAGLGLGRALKVFDAATPLVIDHTTGEGAGQKLAGRMQGAYRKQGDARRAWECRKAQEQENSWLVAGLWNTKGNNSVTWNPIGIRIDFVSDAWGRATSVTFKRDDNALQDLAEHVVRNPSLKERITLDLQEHASATAAQIAYRTKAEEASISAKLREMRLAEEVVVVEAGGGKGKATTWALVPKPEQTRTDTRTDSGFVHAPSNGIYDHDDDDDEEVAF